MSKVQHDGGADKKIVGNTAGHEYPTTFFEFGIGGKNCRISLQHSIVILIDSLVSLVL